MMPFVESYNSTKYDVQSAIFSAPLMFDEQFLVNVELSTASGSKPSSIMCEINPSVMGVRRALHSQRQQAKLNYVWDKPLSYGCTSQ